MITALFPEQGADRRIEIARALTSLQVGIEVLNSALLVEHPAIDTRALTRTLCIASEQAAESITVLVEIVNLRTPPA